MLRSVLTKTVRDARRGLVWWSLGVTALVLLTVLLWPSVRDSPELAQFAEDAPEVLQAFAGGDLDFTSAVGYLDTRLFALLVPLLFLVYAIGAGARAIAGEEETGTLDLLLSHPLSRTRFVLEKLGALIIQLATLALVLLIAVSVAGELVGMDVGFGRIGAAVTAAYLLALAHGVLALLIGAAYGSRAAAIGIPAAVAIAGYLINGLAQIVEPLEPWRGLSPFSYVGEPFARASSRASSRSRSSRLSRPRSRRRSSSAATSPSENPPKGGRPPAEDADTLRG